MKIVGMAFVIIWIVIYARGLRGRRRSPALTGSSL